MPLFFRHALKRVASSRVASSRVARLSVSCIPGAPALATSLRATSTLVVAALFVACSGGEKTATPAADTAKVAPKVSRDIAPDTAGRTLALAAAAAPYRVDDGAASPLSVSGHITSAAPLPVDTMVTPNRDSTGCRPFVDVTFPRERKAKSVRNSKSDSSAPDVGNAIVWLVGVTHGPRDTQPRRVNLMLDDCHFEPRVFVASVGATLVVSNRDDMITSLRFEDHGRTTAPRAIVGFTDPGQVVPNSKVLAAPGLVEVRDEHHPWIRAYVAVAPHPFVAVTDADGEFQFDGVPVGTYQLVVWHERLGARVMPVKVDQGANAPIAVRY